MSKKINFNFGSLEFHDCYAIGIINEGENVRSDENRHLITMCAENYLNKPFGYIYNRTNSYSIDPTIYLETSKMRNLVAIAVVTSNRMQRLNVEIERIFFNKPFEHFNTVEEAEVWMRKMVIHANRQERILQSQNS
ncbi:hypothetical protein [Leptobacterium sp. I13]|uniref:hypothetical protein n=1 Tax=Leptobacterium meishanense TaxID=3128904 RepID=UPI0030ED20FC